LSSESVRDEGQIEAVVERAAEWPVAGFYLVAEVPGAYLVEDPIWLGNMLILASGLKLLGRTVLAGYSSHQMLGYAACNVDAMAAGTWLNVRRFATGKFYAPDEDDVSRRTTGTTALKPYPSTRYSSLTSQLDRAFSRRCGPAVNWDRPTRMLSLPVPSPPPFSGVNGMRSDTT